MFISAFLACCYVRTEKHLFLSQEKMLRRSSRKNATKAAPGVERPTHSVTGSCHRRQEMPREKATVARSWEELGAGRLLQSEGRKQNSFPVFVSRSRLVICRQADRHKICRSESPASWRISPSHMSPIHGPAPSRMGGGAGGGCKPVHKFVCCGVCVSPYASTRMGGWAAGRLPMCPYLLRAGWRASQTILTPAGERERGRERERARGGACSLKTTNLSLVMGVRVGRGGTDGARGWQGFTNVCPVWAAGDLPSLVASVSKPSKSAACPPAVWNTGLEHSTCVYMELVVHVWVPFGVHMRTYA